MRSCALAVLAFGLSLAGCSSLTAQNSRPRPATLPPVLTECDVDQCDHGVEAIWVFEGSNGEAMWNSGPVASLSVEKFDGVNVVINRVDPPGSASARCCAMADGKFRARYTGVLRGDRIEGTVFFNGDSNKLFPWSATVRPAVCDTPQSCPLSLSQLTILGNEAIEYGNLYQAASRCWIAAAAKGEPDAKGYLAVLVSRGKIDSISPSDAFRLAQESTAMNRGAGMMALGELYKNGTGTAPNQQLAEYWDHRGRQIQYQQFQELAWDSKVNVREPANGGQGLLGLLMQAIMEGGNSPSDEAAQNAAADKEWKDNLHQKQEFLNAHPN